MSSPLNRKPWPMKWVFLIIIACIIPYTILTLKYRKETPAYEPNEDRKQRANVLRLLEAGFQRINVSADRPADPQLIIHKITLPAAISQVAGGLTNELTQTLVEIPQLPLSFSKITAARETAALLPYPIVFTCMLGDQKHQLGGAQVFVRGASVVIVPQFEPLSGELTARSKESVVVITLPSGALKTGQYTMQLAGSEQSSQWQLEVR